MSRTVKQKIRLGTLFLFFLLLLTGGVGIFHLVRLKNDAKLILKNNYESLDYGHSMLRYLDSLPFDNKSYIMGFDSVLRLQEYNITEPGERQATVELRKYFSLYRSGVPTPGSVSGIRSAIQQILMLNMTAIETKNQKAGKTADKALTYITLLSTVIFLVGLSFSFNFPSVLTAPIAALKDGIQQISKKNYDHRIHINARDEFGEMAGAFNDMAERLEYFENSNLNKIIFEKTRAEAVINSLKEASIGIDKNGRILFANNQALQLLAMQSKDIVDKPVGDVTRTNELFRYLLEEKDGLPFKIVVENRENYFTKEVMDIDQGEPGSKVIVLRNITSYKELDVAKTNFIATISHELKTPLASSDFSLKLLEDERIGKLSGEQLELLKNLRQDNQRMLRILSELLNMSQVETGKIHLNISRASAVGIAETAISAMSSAAREKRIKIEKRFQDDLEIINADAEKTGWVLNNFLTNAIKYSPESSTIVVNVKKVENGTEFSVVDKGPGIAPEYFLKVFERFFKVPGSKASGTGLGLAISKEFIEAQGGAIWVKSEIGFGSEFGFTLPVS